MKIVSISGFPIKFITQVVFACSKSTMKIAEQCVKIGQNLQQRHQDDVNNVILVFTLFSLVSYDVM